MGWVSVQMDCEEGRRSTARVGSAVQRLCGGSLLCTCSCLTPDPRADAGSNPKAHCKFNSPCCVWYP